MTSAIRLGLGLSVLAMAFGSAACGGSDATASGGTGPIIVGGSGGSSSSSGGTSSGGTSSGGAGTSEGVPLTPTMGWVDGMSNTLGIQGAYFAYADPTTLPSVMSDVMSSPKVCMKGTAAKVDLTCTPMAPATDCYGTFWGAAIGLNLNQPNVTDPMTMMMKGGLPVP
ncbi:MAG TPA: hypothetical protein VKJ01_15180, partial [Candidatus Solibacter sp.]|nr:hypothetical protein [Candidatus Solibacter sp.]